MPEKFWAKAVQCVVYV